MINYEKFTMIYFGQYDYWPWTWVPLGREGGYDPPVGKTCVPLHVGEIFQFRREDLALMIKCLIPDGNESSRQFTYFPLGESNSLIPPPPPHISRFFHQKTEKLCISNKLPPFPCSLQIVVLPVTICYCRAFGLFSPPSRRANLPPPLRWTGKVLA